MSRLPFSRRNRRIAVAILVGVTVVAAYCEREPLLSAAGRWLNISSPLSHPVDDVMVLGGDAEMRPLAAAAIFRAGLAQRVLVPQVIASDEVIDGIMPPHHEVVRQVLVRSGVSPNAVVLLPVVVDSTDREARCLADFLRGHPSRRVAVVTSDFHTRRTRLLFNRDCVLHAANLSFIGAPTDGFDASNWWRFETGLIVYIDEYLKLAKAFVH